MAQFYTILTDVGQAKIANAVALGTTIEITDLAVGDGGGSLPTPSSDATALANELRRAPINTSETDPDNPSWIVVEQVLPPDVGGWTIREVGIFDADGDLIGYGSYPETYKPVLSEGSSRTQTVRFVLEVSDTAAVTLKVDPTLVLATREYADDAVSRHTDADDPHPQYLTQPEAANLYLGIDAKAADSAKLGGRAAGNAAGGVPISNGTLNANLNADKLDGNDASDFDAAGAASAAVSAHEGENDPHPQYLQSAPVTSVNGQTGDVTVNVDVLGAIANSSAGDVGTYAYAYNNGDDKLFGGTDSGSNLGPAGHQDEGGTTFVQTYDASTYASFNGSWQCMGFASGYTGDDGYITLWLRVS